MTKEEELELDIKAAEIGMQCINSFYFFFKTFWPEFSGENYVDNFHVKLICDRLQKYGEMIARGDELRKTVVINVPPGSSKSSICTVAFPLYMWLIKPSCTAANISYSADLSKDHQELSKEIPSSLRWTTLFNKVLTIKHGKPVVVDVCNKNKVQNNFGGKRFSASTGGSITGKHCDIIIEDDPLNPEQAFSDAERATAIRFHDKTVSTRKKNDNCYLNVIIAQRLHEEDVCGHVLKKNLDIDLICLPGEITSSTIVEPSWARDFYIDGVMNPIRKGRKVLIDLKEALGTDAYTTQVLQLPFDLQAQDITPEMFRTKHIKELPNDLIWDVWIDGAYTDKTNNDPTGIDLVTKIGKDIYIRKAYDVYKKLPDLVAFIVRLESEGMFNSKQSRIFIEPKASGYPLAQYIESDTEYNFVLIGQKTKSEGKLVQAGKKARHEMIKPKAESGRIVVVEDGVDDSWIEGYITQICGFPRAAHDEHVDTLGYAINHYYMNENTFLEAWVLRKLEKSVIGSIMTMVTSQVVKSRSGSSQIMAVDYDENDKGDVQMFDYPNTHYFNRYVCSVVLKSESERSGVTCILVYDRLNKVVVAMHVNNEVAPRKIAKKAMEMATLYDKAKLVICIKKDSGLSKNEGMDQSHMVLQEIRKIGYQNLHSRLAINDIKKTKREREYGFEINRSTSREVYLHLKDQLESNKIQELPMEVFEDVSVLERKKETGAIDGREGHEVNCGLAYATALKVDDEWGEKVNMKRSRGSDWAN